MSAAAPATQKVRISHRLAYIAYRGMEFALSCVPLAAVCAFGRGCGHLAYLGSGKYRRLVIRNLRIATANDGVSRADICALARETFARSGANLIGSLRAALMPHDEIVRRMTLDGKELLRDPAIAECGWVIVCAHMGNWETLTQLVPYFKTNSGAIYRPLANPLIDELVRKRRERQGAVVFGRTAGFLGPAAFVRSGGALAVISDQRAGGAGEVCPFFGKLSNCTPLPALLAKRTRAAVITLSLSTTSLGQWRLRARTLPQNSTTAEIMAALETAMRDSLPDVFWFHDRWRTDRTRPLSFYIKTIKAEQVARATVPMRILLTLPDNDPNAAAIIPRMLELRPDLRIDVLHRGHTLLQDPRVIDAGSNMPGRNSKACLEQLDQAHAVPLDAAILLDGDTTLAAAAKQSGLRAIIGTGPAGKPWTRSFARPDSADGWREIADKLAGITRCVA